MSTLLALVDDIAADRCISAEDALRLRKEIFPDGVVSREEAGVLIALEARVGESDEAWSQAFVEALVEHVLQSCAGHVDEATAAWLAASFAGQPPREPELEALVEILDRAESAPEGLQSYVCARIATYLEGNAITAANVELVSRCI